MDSAEAYSDLFANVDEKEDDDNSADRCEHFKYDGGFKCKDWPKLTELQLPHVMNTIPPMKHKEVAVVDITLHSKKVSSIGGDSMSRSASEFSTLNIGSYSVPILVLFEDEMRCELDIPVLAGDNKMEDINQSSSSQLVIDNPETLTDNATGDGTCTEASQKVAQNLDVLRISQIDTFIEHAEQPEEPWMSKCCSPGHYSESQYLLKSKRAVKFTVGEMLTEKKTFPVDSIETKAPTLTAHKKKRKKKIKLKLMDSLGVEINYSNGRKIDDNLAKVSDPVHTKPSSYSQAVKSIHINDTVVHKVPKDQNILNEIVVSQLPPTVTEEQLREVVETFGHVNCIRIQPPVRRFATATIQMSKMEDCVWAVECLNNHLSTDIFPDWIEVVPLIVAHAV